MVLNRDGFAIEGCCQGWLVTGVHRTDVIATGGLNTGGPSTDGS